MSEVEDHMDDVDEPDETMVRFIMTLIVATVIVAVSGYVLSSRRLRARADRSRRRRPDPHGSILSGRGGLLGSGARLTVGVLISLWIDDFPAAFAVRVQRGGADGDLAVAARDVEHVGRQRKS